MNPAIRILDVCYHDRSELRKCFLYGPPHGGVLVTTKRDLQVGDIVDLRIAFSKENAEEMIRGAVLWCRKETGLGINAGVGFFSTEVEKRERILRSPPPAESWEAERGEIRYPLDAQVIFRHTRGLVMHRTKNISVTGMLLSGKHAPLEGFSSRFVVLPKPKDSGIELHGKVVWRDSGGNFGVRFQQIEPTAREALWSLIQSIDEAQNHLETNRSREQYAMSLLQ